MKSNKFYLGSLLALAVFPARTMSFITASAAEAKPIMVAFLVSPDLRIIVGGPPRLIHLLSVFPNLPIISSALE